MSVIGFTNLPSQVEANPVGSGRGVCAFAGIARNPINAAKSKNATRTVSKEEVAYFLMI